MTIKIRFKGESDDRAPYEFECEVTQDTLTALFEMIGSIASNAMSNESSRDSFYKLAAIAFAKYVEPKIDKSELMRRMSNSKVPPWPNPDIFRHDNASPKDFPKTPGHIKTQEMIDEEVRKDFMKRNGFPEEEEEEEDDTNIDKDK